VKGPRFTVDAALPRYPAGCLAGHDLLHLVHRHLIEIANDGMLQARGGNRKIEDPLEVIPVGPESVDQPADEGIPAADAIDDIVMLNTGPVYSRARRTGSPTSYYDSR